MDINVSNTFFILLTCNSSSDNLW